MIYVHYQLSLAFQRRKNSKNITCMRRFCYVCQFLNGKKSENVFSENMKIIIAFIFGVRSKKCLAVRNKICKQRLFFYRIIRLRTPHFYYYHLRLKRLEQKMRTHETNTHVWYFHLIDMLGHFVKWYF